ncbi:MarR family winged helix-turn-helix transcriptional regulator [Silvimonas iriomotensis]|uniref:MarR family transcriptional regulator n=1 Tax=Silvimonas iriomotensis TaxID=449662 RepID=A0ABQ2PAY5_9NEIS|nr:MarR family winged helix-turn-helix transcriptional regulator [Silvimonas iriomotensis]GGP22670.1 MarR family transcriptional regulator [Silvimonas iriomotensis]
MQNTVDNVNRHDADQAEAVFEAIHTVMHLYRSRQYRAMRDDAQELTHMEHKAMGFFARHPDATQSDLVAHSGRDKAQLARLIKGLKDRGLLDATPDPSDRRNVRLRLSAAGEQLFAAAREHAREVADHGVAGLSAGQCAQLLASLAVLRDNLEADRQA